MQFSELREKEVISIRECRKLGKVCDLRFDCNTGCIEQIIVPGKGKGLNFFSSEPEYCIPYRDVKQIGPDVILVEI